LVDPFYKPFLVFKPGQIGLSLLLLPDLREESISVFAQFLGRLVEVDQEGIVLWVGRPYRNKRLEGAVNHLVN
jgi:hypothetical protein